MKRSVSECSKCKRLISLSNVSKHDASCKGPRKKKLPGVDFNLKGTCNAAWNKGLTKQTSDSLKRASITLSDRFTSGELKPSGCCLMTSEQLSVQAKRNKLGGYQPNAGRSKKFKAIDSSGLTVTLQSSYEKTTADLLNELNIKWIRPSYLRYGEKKYFPDFFLVDLDLYLDPKNDYLAVIDAPKIQSVMIENNVKILMLSKAQLTKEHFQTWIS
jgi:hypothetical protein